jgi:hypothetical protein
MSWREDVVEGGCRGGRMSWREVSLWHRNGNKILNGDLSRIDVESHPFGGFYSRIGEMEVNLVS